MAGIVDVFWSFRSPYSYLVTADLLRLKEDFDVEVRLRPVLPIALRAKGRIFDASDKKRPVYITMDSRRRAEYLGLPFRWPKPDPIVQNLETYEVAEDQPNIWRLNALWLEAGKRGKGVDFAHHVAALIWGGTRDWDQGEHLSEASARAGLDLKDLEASVDPDEAEAAIEANHDALEAAGHWGVPTMVFDGEPFFGQDRIDTLRWRLEKLGLLRNGRNEA